MSSLSSEYRPFIVGIFAVVSDGDYTDITTDEEHGFVVGNEVTFQVPAEYGMRQLNGLKAFIVSITDDSIRVHLNTSTFDEFAVPLSPNEPAQVIPVGDQNFGYSSPGGIQPEFIAIPGAFRAPTTR